MKILGYSPCSIALMILPSACFYEPTGAPGGTIMTSDLTTFSSTGVEVTSSVTTPTGSSLETLPSSTEAPTSATTQGLSDTMTVGSTGGMTQGSSEDGSSGIPLPDEPMLELKYDSIKQFKFAWAAVEGAEHYELWERTSPDENFVQLGENLFGSSTDITMPLHLRSEASYMLRACNLMGCTDSANTDVTGSLAVAVGYKKASTVDAGDGYGWSVAISGDGLTIVIGAPYEDSGAPNINGNQADDSANDAGAAYVLVMDGETWAQQAYVKAYNPIPTANFGRSVKLSYDGNTMAVGANGEDVDAAGINIFDSEGTKADSGAAYVFVRDGNTWSQQAYIKASNADVSDEFGIGVALSSDGNTLAVGARYERSAATGIGGDQSDNSAFGAGAVYVFLRQGDAWSQQAYIKASNTEAGDNFGTVLAMTDDGDMLAVGASGEDSAAMGINGDQGNGESQTGAVYVFVRDGTVWSQQAYVKASNPDTNDYFGSCTGLSGDGQTLVVGAPGEASKTTGIGGDQTDDSSPNAGATYIFAIDDMQWTQQAYIKASNTEANDGFGCAAALSADGNYLAVGAPGESSGAAGVGGTQADNSKSQAGAVYVFTRANETWDQRSYVKAPNPDAGDFFTSLALSTDARLLVVGSLFESSITPGNQNDNSAGGAGAVYLY